MRRGREREARLQAFRDGDLGAELDGLERAGVVGRRLGVGLQPRGLLRRLERQRPRGLRVAAGARGGQRVAGRLGGGGVAARVQRLAQDRGDGAVEPGPRGRRDVVVDRVADDRVGEPEAPGRVGPDLHEPAGERRFERLGDRLARQRADPGHPRDRERAPHHTGDRQHLAGGRRERFEPLPDDLAHAVGHRQRQRRAVTAQVAALREQPHQLAQEERVAGRAVVQRARGVRRQLGARRQEIADGLARQATQHHSPQPAVAFHAVEHAGQRMARVDLGVAVGEGHERAGLRGGEVEVREQQERRAVGGVHVLERDQQPLRPRGRLQQRGHGVEHAQPLLLARVDPRPRGGRLGRAPVARQPAQVVEHGDRQPAGRRDERPQRRAPRPERARILAGPPAHDGGAARPRLRHELVDQAGLPDPRLPRDGRELQALGARGVERGGERRELRLAADERVAVVGHDRPRQAGRAAEPVERVAHLRGVGGTRLRILGEEREHEAVERAGDAGRVARGAVGHRVAVLGDQTRHVGRLERRPSRQQLPQRRAERVEVARRQRRRGRRLLRRDVIRRPGRRTARLGRVPGAGGDAEVTQPGAAVRGEPDVVRLHVAVHDAVRVRMRERVGELAAHAQDLGQRQPVVRAGREPVGERPAGHEARDDVERLVVLDRVVHRDHVRVVAEPRHEARLAPHPGAHLRSRRALAGARERHGPIEREVMGQPDLLGAAAAEQPLREVAIGDQPRGRGRRRGHRHRQRRAGRAFLRARRQRTAAVRAGGGQRSGHRRRGPF